MHKHLSVGNFDSCAWW